MQLHATTELTKLRSPPPVFLLAPVPGSSVSSPKTEHSRRSPPQGHHSSIASMVSILVPSSTFPNQHPFFCPPPASSPRAPSCRGYGCRSRRSQPLSPMPGATKVEPPPPPLSSHALGFENRGRKRRPGKAPRARACGHGDAERRGNALFLSREQIKAREFFFGSSPSLWALRTPPGPGKNKEKKQQEA